MEPTMTRIRLAMPYLVHPGTKNINGFYKVIVKWPDGKREEFDSEEEVKARIEGRKFSYENLLKELPGDDLREMFGTFV